MTFFFFQRDVDNGNLQPSLVVKAIQIRFKAPSVTQRTDQIKFSFKFLVSPIIIYLVHITLFTESETPHKLPPLTMI